MRKLTLFLGMAVVACCSVFAQQSASDLFISEYCEYNQTVSTPQYFNHYIEIYNGTGKAVDMSKYQLWRSMNASGWNNNNGVVVAPPTLKGILENNKTFVITRPNTSAAPISIAADSAQSWSFLNISGDDAVGLAKDDGTGTFVLIDLIGSETVDPGEYWSVAGEANGTQNRTIVRKPTTCGPTTDWSLSAGTTADNSQWIVFPQNDISNINQHTSLCNGVEMPDTTTVPPTEMKKLKLSALFIGNSYTYYNDLPILIDKLANTVGDTLKHSESFPGGYTLQQHYALPATQTALKAKNYDYVVLQEQSQRPATDSTSFFKYALMLDSIRNIYSPCGQTMYYMTWGRKFGDSNNCSTLPEVCTYEGMDSLLNLRYRMAQEKTGALISPVGAVRNYLRKNHPEIELYESDNSHPSPAGSFVSAVTFYTAMFKKDPMLTTYNFSIGESIAKIIKESVKTVVFDSLNSWNTYAPGADSTISININSPLTTDTLTVSETFTAEANISTSKGTISEVLFFLNGTKVGTKTEGPYQIELTSVLTGFNSLIVKVVNSEGGVNFQRVNFYVEKKSTIGIESFSQTKRPFTFFPNPAETVLNIEMDDSFQSGSFSIFNLSGQVVKNGVLASKMNVCDISGLQPNEYIVQVKVDDQLFSEKIIKK